MSPINKETVQQKLIKLNETVQAIETGFKHDRATFLRDTMMQDALTFKLLRSIEAVIDIGNHILAEAFQKSAKTYRDVILSLGETGVIPKSLAEDNATMADFRNKLVHDYDRVDPEKVFDYLEKAPAVFREFAKRYAEFIEKQ